MYILSKKTIAASGLFLFVVALIAVVQFARAQEGVVVDGARYGTLVEALKYTLPHERGTVKGREMAKIKTVPKTQRGDYFIEVVDMKPREGGVEVFARAWDKNGNQFGFGPDGTVDIERFVIINPPILVPDTNGTVVREWTDSEGVFHHRKYREDTTEALLQDLEHTLLVKKEKYTSAYIIPGKIGNTTTIMRPDANPESTTVDGYVGISGQSDWSTARNAVSGSSSSDTQTSDSIGSSSFNGSTYAIQRGIYLFNDNGSIGADNVTSATFSLFSNGNIVQNTNSASLVLVDTTPASNTAIVNDDYNDFSTTQYGSIALSSYTGTDGAQNNITINASGLDKIETSTAGTGIIKFGLRNSLDVNNTTPTGGNTPGAYYADQSGTTNDPKIVVEHSPAPPVLSNVQSSNITANTAIITWTTNITATSQVHYDTALPVTGADPSVYDGTATTSHSVTLSNLSPGTLHYYFASSTGNSISATSTELSFTTLALNISNIRATNTGSGWADIKWTTSANADNKVWYSLTSPVSATNYTEVYNATATTSHSLYLSGLLHNAVYYYTVTSTNGTGGTSTSTEKQFNTTSTALCTE